MAFLARHRHDIRGVLLEAGGFTSHTERFGEDRVTCGEVLYPKPGFPDGTLVGDLVTGEGIPSGTFDCLILNRRRIDRTSLLADGIDGMTGCIMRQEDPPDAKV